jgi:hypothetical protein
VRRILESLRVVATRFTDLNALLKGSASVDKALASAQEGLKGIQAELTVLGQERAQLVQAQGTVDLSEGDARLKELRARQQELQQFITRLEGIRAENQETQRLNTALERARLLEAEAKFDDAIKLYESVLAARPGAKELKEVRAQLTKLKAAWERKGPEPAQAREFIYNTWPGLDVKGIRAQAAEAKKAFEVCQKAGDWLTPQKLLQVNVEHAAALKNRLEALRGARDSEDNRAEAKALIEVAATLRQLHNDASAFVSKSKQ